METEITPISRAVMFRFTFPECDKSYVVIDVFDNRSYVKIIPEENKIIGYTIKNSGRVPVNFKNYFVIVFDKPFTYTASVDKNEIKNNTLEINSDHTRAIIGFPPRRGEKVYTRCRLIVHQS